MALFKIFRGPSERLKDVKPTEGYAYFTPDDGKFYIDISDGEIPIVGDSSQTGANRICINSGANFPQGLILDCGLASGWTEVIIAHILDSGDSDLSDEEDAIFYDLGDSDLSDELTLIIYDNGNSYM